MTELWVTLIFLIIFSGFFSGSETGMTAINRYRLRNAARKKNPAAMRVMKLLQRPDRLLGVILLGNTFVNILASALATLLAVHYYGDVGVFFSTVAMTFVVLIFSETAPKTFAVLYPERVAYPASRLLVFFLAIFSPLVWFVNLIANGVLRLFGVNPQKGHHDSLSLEELRTLVNETAGMVSMTYRTIMLRVLDLDKVTIEDVMVPRADMYAIDIKAEWETVVQQLLHSPYSTVVAVNGDLNEVIGVLSVRSVLYQLGAGELTRELLLKHLSQPYFVPAGAEAKHQLLQFQQNKESMGLVVDEYGDLVGCLTAQDIIEEVVGEFTEGASDFDSSVTANRDGSVLVHGAVMVRDLNRKLAWSLPVTGPKTLSGLLIEYLEVIPETEVGVRIAGYPMEITEMRDGRVYQVRVWPKLYVEPAG